jgi:phage repressor protein C with HTH and peptisase S24 domain
MKEQGLERKQAVKIGRIVEGFNNARRRGTEPSIDEWVKKYASPDAPADQLRQQLEMSLALLESAKSPWPSQEIPDQTEQSIRQKLLPSFSSGPENTNEIKILDVPHPLTREYDGIPVVRLAAAGQMMPCEPDALMTIEGWEKITRPFDLPYKEIFAVQIKGDSLEPIIADGSYAVIDPRKEAKSGSLALVINKEYEASVKLIKIHSNKVTLVSTNPEYPPKEISKKNIWRMYPVVWIKFRAGKK